MPTNDPSEGFTGLQQWSEPLIFDRLHFAYRGFSPTRRSPAG